MIEAWSLVIIKTLPLEATTGINRRYPSSPYFKVAAAFDIRSFPLRVNVPASLKFERPYWITKHGQVHGIVYVFSSLFFINAVPMHF